MLLLRCGVKGRRYSPGTLAHKLLGQVCGVHLSVFLHLLAKEHAT